MDKETELVFENLEKLSEEELSELISHLDTIEKERQEIIKEYVRELEQKKIAAIRTELGLIEKNN